MTTGKFFEQVGMVVPSIAAGWVSAWVELFENTAIIRPGASGQISITGAAIATLVAIVIVALCQSLPSRRLKQFTIAFLCAFGGLGIACYSMRFFLSRPISREASEILFYVWDLTYVAFIIVMVVTILFATLFALSKEVQPK